MSAQPVWTPVTGSQELDEVMSARIGNDIYSYYKTHTKNLTVTFAKRGGQRGLIITQNADFAAHEDRADIFLKYSQVKELAEILEDAIPRMAREIVRIGGE